MVGFGKGVYLSALTAEILVDDVTVFSKVADVISVVPNYITLNTIVEIDLTAGQVVKLKTTGNTITGGSASYYGVNLNFVITNYMGEPANMCLNANTTGTYNTQQPTTVYTESQMKAHPRPTY